VAERIAVLFGEALASVDQAIELDPDYNIVWDLTGLANPIDAERLDNGNTIFVEFGESYANGRVTEVDTDGNEVWKYDTGLNWPWDVERLDNGNTLIADQKNNRVIEVEEDGTIAWQVSTGLKNTDRPNLFWPLDAERLDNGNTLIVDLRNDRVIEVEPDLDVVWETPHIGSLQDAERLDNGNTLITTVGNIVFEYDPAFNTVWSYTGVGYPGDAERLTNGNTIITDGWIYSKVLEVDSAGTVVWQPTGLGFNWPYDVERIGDAPPTPEELIDDAIEDILDMDLPAGAENSLTGMLEFVLGKLEDGKENTALNKLNSFINHVNGYLNNPNDMQLTDEQAKELIAAAEAIIAGIEEG